MQRIEGFIHANVPELAIKKARKGSVKLRNAGYLEDAAITPAVPTAVPMAPPIKPPITVALDTKLVLGE